MARTTKADLEAQASDAVVRALTSLGHQGAEAAPHRDRDLIVTVDGIDLPVELKAASVITPEVAARMVASRAHWSKAVSLVAVGDLITEPAQQTLREAGWGWLDRRGHLVLRGKGVHIDADVPADVRPTVEPHKPISGVAAISWAAALLMSPEDPPSMREVARRSSISHSAIVTAAKRLRAASLVRSDGRPLAPELFWVLAEKWKPNLIALAELPPTGDSKLATTLSVNPTDDGGGWVVAGTVGAVAWGAPLVVGIDYPPDFYVPSTAVLRQAMLRLGQPPRFEDRACTVAVAPTPLVHTEQYLREHAEGARWSFAPGLFAALDLAQDRSRGAEILADWEPKDFTRVW